MNIYGAAGFSLAATTNRLYLFGVSNADNADPYPCVTLTDFYDQPQIGGYSDQIISMFNIDNIVGVDEFQNEEEILVFPNPTSNYFHVQIKINKLEKNLKLTLDIFDITGRLINQMPIEIDSDGTCSKEISLKDYASGLYLIKINSKNNILVKKIIKE